MSTESQYYKYNPEKRNIFIEIHGNRINFVKEIILGFFSLITSPCSAVCEVFLRKRFGERYITLAQSIGVFLLIQFLVPMLPIPKSDLYVGLVLVNDFFLGFLGHVYNTQA